MDILSSELLKEAGYQPVVRTSRSERARREGVAATFASGRFYDPVYRLADQRRASQTNQTPIKTGETQ